LSFCSSEERSYLKDIEKLIKKSIPVKCWVGTQQEEPLIAKSTAPIKTNNLQTTKRLAIQKINRV
jgi:superfamily II DNA/RNA helicase